MLGVLVLSSGCGEKQSLQVIHNNDRVTELERRADLNDQLNVMQNTLINMNAESLGLLDTRVSTLETKAAQLQIDLDAEIAARIAGDENLQELQDQERDARIAGDIDSADALAAAIVQQQANNNQQQNKINTLQAQMAAQSLVNLIVQGQIASINSKFPVINSSLSSLQSQVNNVNTSVSTLQSDLSILQLSVGTLQSRMLGAESDIDLLQSQVIGLQSQINEEGTKVYKCNAPDSTERIFKINSKYYATMNRVTTQSMQVITGSTPQTIVIPKLCKKNSNNYLLLANSNGSCGNNETAVAGTGVTTIVNSYSTATVTVVSSVKIALDLLIDGSYSTTDGGSACSFSIGNGGTTSTNLIQVQ